MILEKKSKFLELWLPVLVPPFFFFVMFLVMVLRVNRYVDEDIALVNGYYFFNSFFQRDNEFLVKAAVLDGANSIGLLVTLPAALAHKLTGDILGPRIVMGVWSFLFFLAAGLGGVEALQKVLGRGLSNAEKLFSTWILIAWLYVVPIGIQIQIMCLSEYPGLACLFFSFYFLLKDRFFAAAVFASMAASLKLNFILFFPLIALLGAEGISIKRDTPSYRKKFEYLLQLVALFMAPLLALQILKYFLYGSQGFTYGWRWYLNWILNTSGAGFNQAAVKVNEFPSFSMGSKIFYGVSSLAPLGLALCFFRSRRKWSWLYLGLLGLAGTILVASYQWYFLANLKWLRRTLYFMVPGVWVVFVSLILLLFIWGSKDRRRQWLGLGVLGFLAVWLIYKRTFGPIRAGEMPVLTQEERVRFDPNYTVLFNLKENLADPAVFQRVMDNSK